MKILAEKSRTDWPYGCLCRRRGRSTWNQAVGRRGSARRGRGNRRRAGPTARRGGAPRGRRRRRPMRRRRRSRRGRSGTAATWLWRRRCRRPPPPPWGPPPAPRASRSCASPAPQKRPPPWSSLSSPTKRGCGRSGTRARIGRWRRLRGAREACGPSDDAAGLLEGLRLSWRVQDWADVQCAMYIFQSSLVVRGGVDVTQKQLSYLIWLTTSSVIHLYSVLDKEYFKLLNLQHRLLLPLESLKRSWNTSTKGSSSIINKKDEVASNSTLRTWLVVRFGLLVAHSN